MKIYKFYTGLASKYAHIHAQLGQDTSIGSKIKVMWDDWLAKGNEVPDFVFGMYIICRKSIALELKKNFNGLDYLDFQWTENPKEIIAKDKKRLKWLPNEKVELCALISKVDFPYLSQSTLELGISGQTGESGWIKKIIGSASLKGTTITPREEGKGIFFSEDIVSNYDFFTAEKSSILLCTERVKKFIEYEKYSNVFLLEVGEII